LFGALDVSGEEDNAGRLEAREKGSEVRCHLEGVEANNE
jgi:hypothetical protein